MSYPLLCSDNALWDRSSGKGFELCNIDSPCNDLLRSVFEESKVAPTDKIKGFVAPQKVEA